MESKKITLWALVLLAIIGGIWFVSKKQSPAVSGETIKVAALLSLTGDAAAWGENAQKAIQLATEEANQKGGINGKQIEIIYEDTAGDAKRAVSAYQKVTSIDHVVAVLGPLNQTEDLAVMPLIIQTGTPTIIPGYVPLKNRTNLGNPLFVWMDAEVEAGRLAQYLFDQGIRTVAVIGTLDSWENTVSTSFAEKFKLLGGTVTEQEMVQPDTADMKLPVTKVLATKPQAIFLGTYYQFINSTKVLRDLGYTGKLYGIEVDDYLAKETAGWTSGLDFIAPDYYKDDFIKAFETKFGRAPGLPAGQSYDAANILFSFLKQSSDQKNMLEAMKNFTNYTGVSGELTIASDGRTYLPTALFELKNGQITRLSSLP